ncbi:MAG: ParA family protein [Candidatus Kerfeldbacteria bacterium]|nr:ParA family protein [Candidatus Kerfeldbacteria bacterium]
MPRIIAVVNQKGGVGKTTTSINLGAYLAGLSQRVLLVDLDPQANATSGLGIDHKQLAKGIYEVLATDADVTEAIVPSSIPGLDVLPATLSLAGANIELVPLDRREFLLEDQLQKLADYDYIIIDSPPSLGLLTVNGLVAAREVLIPVQSEYYSLEGLGQLMETIELVKSNLQPDLKILGIVLTMYDPRFRLSSAVLEELYKYFPQEQIFKSVIPRNVRLAEAPSYGQTIVHYDPKSPGAKAYKKLAHEIHGTKKPS